MNCICGHRWVDHEERCTMCSCFRYRPVAQTTNCRCAIVEIDKNLPVEALERMTQEQRVRLAARLFDEQAAEIMRLYYMPVRSAVQ